MKQQSAIAVSTARNLEVGDLFAYETSGRLASGVIVSVVYAVYQLDDDSRSYMESKVNLEIPSDPFAPLGGPTQSLVIYRPVPWFSGETGALEHIFLDHDHMVAVFSYDPVYNSSARSFTEIKDCGE